MVLLPVHTHYFQRIKVKKNLYISYQFLTTYSGLTTCSCELFPGMKIFDIFPPQKQLPIKLSCKYSFRNLKIANKLGNHIVISP